MGNIRLSYALNPVGNALTIVEENHYYPFGLKHANYNSGKQIFEIELAQLKLKPAPPYFRNGNNYKYQGQERQEDLGLNWDSFKWRNYDYAIGRFMNVDPLSEKYSYQSHYNFSENRVIDSRELEGLEAVRFDKKDGVQNFVVVVKGYKSPQNEGDTQAESYDLTSLPMLTELNSETTKVVVFDSSPGSNTINDISESIINFSNAHSDGFVIAVGHSMGADNLVEMVKENKNILVDKLITVDIATPTYSDSNIPSTVPSATNYYQTDSFTGGEIIRADNPTKTKIQNILVPNTSHTTIDNAVAPKIVEMVSNIINTNPIPLRN